jgi:DNA-binding NarL/FixJ family response regulator
MARGRISVLLSDDSTIVREGVQALLAREPDIEVVGLASDYDELKDRAELRASRAGRWRVPAGR